MSKFLHAKKQDGRPAFNFMDLRQLSIYLNRSEDEQNLLYCISRRMPSYLKLKNFIYYYQLTLVKV